MTLNEVPRYIRTKHFFDVSRQTVYNWAKLGVRGIKLRTLKLGPRNILTTKEWVDAFLADTAR